MEVTGACARHAHDQANLTMHYTPLIVNQAGPTGCGPCVAMHMSNSHAVNEMNMVKLYNIYINRYANSNTTFNFTASV
jgi:hypothetical protein